MNKGSAAKWMELIQSGHYHLGDGWGLKSTAINWRVIPIQYSPAGILEEFLQSELLVLDWSETQYMNREGTSSFRISKDTQKRLRAKTDLFDVDSWFSGERKTEVKDYVNRIAIADTQQLIQYIEANYETF